MHAYDHIDLIAVLAAGLLGGLAACGGDSKSDGSYFGGAAGAAAVVAGGSGGSTSPTAPNTGGTNGPTGPAGTGAADSSGGSQSPGGNATDEIAGSSAAGQTTQSGAGGQPAGGGTANLAGGGGLTSAEGAAGTSAGGVSAAAGAGPTVPVTFADNCQELSPCGGELSGTWDYASVCIDYDFGQAAQTFCPDATVQTSGSLSGSVTFTSTTMRRTATLTLAGTLQVPESCTEGAQCATLALALSALLAAEVDEVTCADASDGCTCDLGRTETVDESASYTTAGTTLTTTGEAGNQRTFAYCVDGDTLTYVETTEGGTATVDPGISELARR